MTRNLFFYLYLCAFLGCISCSENLNDELVINEKIQKEYAISPNVSGMIRFSEILSKAVAGNFELRNFLKTEALKTMDNDYDIFYPYSKNELVSEGKSFRDILVEYAANEEELTNIEELLPLLTIYVPELPSGFDAGTWDAKNEIPCVANPVIKNDSVNFYYDGEIVLSIKPNEIPGWPTLVVKNNERIRLKDKNAATTLLRSSSYDDAYEFIDEAFNGQQSTSLRAERGDDPYNTGSPIVISPLLVGAYNEMGLASNYWQRDNIYYGLTKQSGITGTGLLNTQYYEKIVSIIFNPSAYGRMADQAGDPTYSQIIDINGSINTRNGSGFFWTEGNFEIVIDILINNLSGAGTNITKFFSVSPFELFNIRYDVSNITLFLGRIINVYTPTEITAKAYNPNINLVTWDLENNGSAWKFIISESDEQTTETYSTTVTTEYATNFGLTFGGYQGKIGLNFGASAKRTQTNTYTIVTTKGSDNLGTVELFFYDPVLLDINARDVKTLYHISNPYVSLCVIPSPKF